MGCWVGARAVGWEHGLLGTFRTLKGLQGGLRSTWNPGFSTQPLEEEP